MNEHPSASELEYLDYTAIRRMYPIGKGLTYKLMALCPNVIVGYRGGSPKRLVRKAVFERMMQRAEQDGVALVELARMTDEEFGEWLNRD